MPEIRNALPSVRTVRRALGILGLVLLVIVVGVAVLFAVPQVVGAEQSYVVLSGSMSPAIGPGDIILVDAVPIEAVEVGDVVTFNRGEGAPTTHRVIDIAQTDGERALVTKGDANEEADPGLVHSSQLVGRVMTLGGTLLVIPKFGFVVDFANSNTGAVLVVFIPLTLFILNEVYVRLGSNAQQSSTSDESGAESLAASPEGPPLAPDPVLGGTAPAVEPTSSAGSPGPTSADDEEVVASVATPDLTLTLLVLAVLVPYSGWMLLETQTTPSAMIFAGGLVGLTLLSYGRLRLWLRARRSTKSAAPDSKASAHGNGETGSSPMAFDEHADFGPTSGASLADTSTNSSEPTADQSAGSDDRRGAQ